MACGPASADKALKPLRSTKELRLGYALGGRSYFVVAGATSQAGGSNWCCGCGYPLGFFSGHSLILRPTAP